MLSGRYIVSQRYRDIPHDLNDRWFAVGVVCRYVSFSVDGVLVVRFAGHAAGGSCLSVRCAVV